MERMSSIEEDENMKNILDIIQKRKCTECEHFRVCVIYKSIEPGIAQLTVQGHKPPVKMELFASICNEYVPLVTKAQVKRNKR